MPADSSTGGYLLPEPYSVLDTESGLGLDTESGESLLPEFSGAFPPPDDLDLDVLLQSVVVGLTGISGKLVWPRWQNPPPTIPPVSVDWCAIGVMSETPDDNAYIFHTGGTGSVMGFDTLFDHEEIDVLASFYGPNAAKNAKVLRNGFQIPQNTEVLAANQIRWVSCGPVITAPDLINEQWISHKDIHIRLRRKVTRIYPVFDILSAAIHLFDDSGAVDRTFIVPPT